MLQLLILEPMLVMTVKCLMDWMDTYHCTTHIICADVDFQSTEVQDFFRHFGIKPFSTSPYTPWPNRAEASVRVLNATLHDLCDQIGTLPELKQVTVIELLRKTAVARNSMVTYGENTVELVFWKKAQSHFEYREFFSGAVVCSRYTSRSDGPSTFRNGNDFFLEARQRADL